MIAIHRRGWGDRSSSFLHHGHNMFVFSAVHSSFAWRLGSLTSQKVVDGAGAGGGLVYGAIC